MYPKPFRYENSRSPYYHFKVTLRDGTRIKRSTKCREFREAQKYVKRFVDNLQYEQLTLGRYAEKFTQYNTSPRVRRILSENRTIGEAYVKVQGSYITKYILTDPIAKKQLCEVRPGDIIDFRTRIAPRVSYQTNTANKVLNAIKVIFSEARLRGDIPSDPTIGIGPIHYQPTIRSILTLDEMRSLFSDPGRFPSTLAYQVYRFAAYTGMRRSEVLALHWDQLKESILTVDRAWKSRTEIGPPKSGKSRRIPLAPSVLENLPERKHKLIFCYPKNGKRLGNTWWKYQWSLIVDWEEKRIKEDGEEETIIHKIHEKAQPHSLRHALNSYLIKMGAPLQYIQEYMGWSRRGILTQSQEWYTHIEPEDMQVIPDIIERMYAISTESE